MFAIKDTFQSIEKANNSLFQENIDFQKKIIAKSMEKYVINLRDISKRIVEEILSNRSLMINLVDIKNIDNYTYEHSLNVAILSLVLSIELKLPRSELYKVFIGALLHDIGKAFLPASITKKRTPLTEEEEEIMKEHTKLGYEYLKESYGVDPKSRLVCLQHHELSNGSGYPSGYNSSQIHKFSKIVAIANIYDEMTSDSPNARAVPPNEAIEFLYASAGTLFDFDLVEMFSRKINPYPEGTLVDLSNGKIGIVKSVNLNFPLRPVVKIFEHKKSIRNLTEVDLMKETNITILKIRYEDPDK
jgi:putative nucleotidyltransferase with HDIG domain